MGLHSREIWIAYFLDLSKDTAVVFLISNRFNI